MAEEDSLDGLLGQVGMGRWQLLALLINCFIWAVMAPHTIGTTLLNAPVNFRCAPLQDPFYSHVNSSDSSWTESPLHVVLLGEAADNATSDGANQTVSGLTAFDNTCFEEAPLHVLPGIYDTENDSWVVDDHGGLHKLQPGDEFLLKEGLGERKLIEVAVPSCPSVIYDDSIFTDTITTEWHLICEHSLHRTLFQNSYTLGIMVGCLVGGDIGDRFGRVAAIRTGAVLHVLSSLVVAFTTNFSVLLVARFLVGVTNLCILVPAVTLALETCPASLRGAVGMGVGLPYSLGVMFFGGAGYLLRSWRHLYMATSFPAFLMLPVSFILDESPRWLLQKGRLTEAKAVLQKAAKANRSSLPHDSQLDTLLLHVAQQEAVDGESPKVLSLGDRARLAWDEVGSFVRTPAMRIISVVAPINWIFSEIIYYGIIFNANNFSHSNPFVYVALTGVSDAIAILVGAPIAAKIGRRNTTGLAQCLAGLLTVLVLGVPDDLRWLQWLLVMGGFLMAAAAAQILYVYTPELYPTTLRTRGFAFCNLTGYAGAFMAPFIPDVLAHLGWWVTNATLGLAGIVGGLIIFLLPETKDRVLCETVEDIEERAKDRKQKREEDKKNKKLEKENKKNAECEKKKGAGNGVAVSEGNSECKDNQNMNIFPKTDGEIVKDIVMSNPLRFSNNHLARMASTTKNNRASASSSINCLLDSPESLSTNSFGTKNIPSFVDSLSESRNCKDSTIFGKTNEAFEKETSFPIEVPHDIETSKKLS